MRTRKWTAGVAACLLLVPLGLGLRSAGPGPTPHFTGTAGCSARACHGGGTANAGGGVHQNEYSLWLAHDRHARAYAVLGEERAQLMARNLGSADARTDSRCLACHTYPAAAANPALKDLRADGVGCEACHGASQGPRPWLAEHTTAAWEKLTPAQKAEHGMTPLADLAVQARTCAGCHVGAPADPDQGIPARDLYHDLMAAGHPRLAFEFSTFRRNMPPHWREDRYTTADPGHSARVWAVGQVVSAQAALDLLAERARVSEQDKSRPWPEFSEYDCFACHTALQPAGWKKGPYRSPVGLGKLRPVDWYSTLLPVLDDKLRAPYADLDRVLRQPTPNRKATLDQVSALRPLLADLLKQVKQEKYDRPAVQAVLAKLASRAPNVPRMTWDEMTQTALAVADLEQALGQKPAAPLRGLFKQLAYPAGLESPGLARDNPAARKELQALLEALKGP